MIHMHISYICNAFDSIRFAFIFFKFILLTGIKIIYKIISVIVFQCQATRCGFELRQIHQFDLFE